MIDTNLLDKVKQANPLIYNITNIVVANYVANGLLAIGASPIMANAKQEASELAQICSALSINIGTLTSGQIETMLIAGKSANLANKPVILDPVGVGATSFRQSSVDKLLQEIRFNAIRGNAGELAKLAGVQWQAKGVDAGCADNSNTNNKNNLAHIAKIVAKKYSTKVLLSGAEDLITDGEKIIYVKNGTDLFSKITGAGCLQGAVCAAFLAIEDSLMALSTAAAFYSIAGEVALAEGLLSSGIFSIKFLDSLATTSAQDIKVKANIKIES